jgi:hypothetical protein
MPLFRFHQGGLEDSLKNTIIVKNDVELRNKIIDFYFNVPLLFALNKEFFIKVFIPYDLHLKDSFDPRCGWYTHYVSVDLFQKDNFSIIGFLSEPMET